MSPKYQSILRDSVFDFARSHPGFVLNTLGAKCGVLAVWFAVFVNVGLIAAWFCRRSFRIELAFAGASLFAAIPGILVIPRLNYVSNLLAFATIYGIVRVNGFLEETSLRSMPIVRFVSAFKSQQSELNDGLRHQQHDGKANVA